MGKGGYVSMLAFSSFINCTLIGAISSVSSLTGVTILLIALQILLGSRHFSNPKKVIDINCDVD